MKKIKLLYAMLPVVLLCGCFDSRDMKDVAIVMGIGVDAGENTAYKTYTQVVIPKGLAHDGGGDTFENFSGEGNHLGKCIDNTALKCGKYMYLSHATALLIGEKVAEQGIYEILDYFMRDNDLRANLTVAVAQENAKKIMETESSLVRVPISGIASLDRRFGETSLGQAPTIFGFVSDMLKKECATLVPVILAEDKEYSVSGSAIFKDGKMTGKISNTEARGVLWLLDKIENGIMTIYFDKASLDVKIDGASSKIKPVFNEDISVDADIKCKMSLLRDDLGIVSAYGVEAVEQRINETIKSEILASLKKVQDMGADVYGFGDKIYRYNPEKWREIENSWDEKFKKLNVNIEVKSEIKEAGSILESAEKM